MTTAFGIAWLRAFLDEASGLTFDDAQAAEVAVIQRHDLPLTRGLRLLVGAAEPRAGHIEREPLLVFLTDAGVKGPLDEAVRADVPRLMAALLLLAGRVAAIVDPDLAPSEERIDRLLHRHPGRPTRWELERTARVMELTL